jgi:hypothetical protein
MGVITKVGVLPTMVEIVKKTSIFFIKKFIEEKNLWK